MITLLDEINGKNKKNITENFIKFLVKKGYTSSDAIVNILAQEEEFAKVELGDSTFIDVDETPYKQFAAYTRQQMFIQNL